MFRKLFLEILFLSLLATFNPGVSSYFAYSNTSLADSASIQLNLPVPGEPWRAPAGFELLFSAPAVEMYRKSYPEGTPDYVQVVQLGQGAAVELMYASLDTPRPGRGAYGGNDARFNLESMQGFWALAERTAETAFCVSNGSFFYMEETPTRLPFPLKVDGEILTEGFGLEQYPGQKLMLELWADHANIRPLDGSALYKSKAPNIIAGLTEDANKRSKFAVGRTFIGIEDRDDDGEMEVLYLLNTQTHTQSGAAQILRQFGAQKIMMLDGGGSTQLICQGEEYIASGRLIPQAIAVYAADAASWRAAQGEEQREGSVLEEGDENGGEAAGQEGELQSPQVYEGQASGLEGVGESASGEAQLHLRDVLWVPVILVPLGVLLVLFFRRMRKE